MSDEQQPPQNNQEEQTAANNNKDEPLTKESAAWLASLNATCNRLTTQYLTILRAAAAINPKAAQSNSGSTEGHRAGGTMLDPSDPPPSLTTNAALSSLQAQLAAQNICVASSQLLDLIRTLRLSLLLMDGIPAQDEGDSCVTHTHGAIDEEEVMEVDKAREIMEEALREASELEVQMAMKIGGGNVS
eukprot:CAMPEP_0196812772 /NCGR_PEP_ID=MMETSP1362-20130617/30731_1 /TAXON_ID=163516 /ORGANISM="Leptocylindrus danicus, Strain CCMP1856" /LENGTH=187 /DNA_ID=CAMNT_0042188651 /DNA_START=114 /DNA_END=677 /DNA_ORIENTATION=+